MPWAARAANYLHGPAAKPHAWASFSGFSVSVLETCCQCVTGLARGGTALNCVVVTSRRNSLHVGLAFLHAWYCMAWTIMDAYVHQVEINSNDTA